MLLGIIPFALVLGAQATQKGFSFIEVPLFTGLNFAGGSEFAILELWTNPPNILMLMFITFLVNSRHLLMGASLVPYLRHLPNKQVFPALFFMCDESWAVALRMHKRQLRPASIMPLICLFTQVSVLLFYLMWVGFTALGGAIGPILGDASRFGFDMAFPAVFLVLLRGMWKRFTRSATMVGQFSYGCTGIFIFAALGWHVSIGAIAGIASAYWLLGDKE